MVGTLTAGFVLLSSVGVSRSLWIAVAANLLIGAIALALPEGAFLGGANRPAPTPAETKLEEPPRSALVPPMAAHLVLWGIGLSGFCALGYEVLWTRVLSMVVGTSVYSFAIMLVAFLSGIGFGSQAEVLLAKLLRGWNTGWRPAVATFGFVQMAIGVSALATTILLRSVPLYAARLQGLLLVQGGEFAARQGASFLVAFAFMALPAFFMGLAFPIAGVVHARRSGSVGGAVGQVLAFNTIGAILGAAGSGFVLVFLFGIERSLQMLSVVNLGFGLAVLAAVFAPSRGRIAVAAIGSTTAALLVVLAVVPDWARMWDRQFFAVYRNNQRDVFDTPERVRDALENTEVLVYNEGINETISVIRPKASAQAFIVNGRVEASTHKEDIQCQRTLGHLPMLVHPNPRKVFVLGLGTGMTLGATSIHPEVEQITLAEIEPGVLPAARTFGEFNNHVLDSPKLRIVHNDGRNFLRTTREKFDVITADPIHPWSGGASYLYTTEYFRTAAEHLAPGGVMCQWLPIYELTVEDVRSVVRTFAENFKYTAIWLTYYDAEILASNEPLVLDESLLERRFANPAIARDLAAVEMGTPRDFLSYLVMGDAGVRAFARGGVINTDDNLWLEFSAPRSQGVVELAGINVEALATRRESVLGYSRALVDPDSEADRMDYWTRVEPAASAVDRAHSLGLWNLWSGQEFSTLLEWLRRDFPDFAPARFLDGRYTLAMGRIARPVSAERFGVLDERGQSSMLEITAVTMRVGEDRGVVVFVDNAVRDIYGQRYVDAPEAELDGRLSEMTAQVFEKLRLAYAVAVEDARTRGGDLPAKSVLVPVLRREVESITARTSSGGE